MAYDIELERPVRPADMRRHRALHSRRSRRGALADAIAAVINALFG